MFRWDWDRGAFEREVRVEIEYLTKVYGDDASRVAAEKAARPSNRTQRRKILEEAHRRMTSGPPQPRRGLLNLILRK